MRTDMLQLWKNGTYHQVLSGRITKASAQQKKTQLEARPSNKRAKFSNMGMNNEKEQGN